MVEGVTGTPQLSSPSARYSSYTLNQTSSSLAVFSTSLRPPSIPPQLRIWAQQRR